MVNITLQLEAIPLSSSVAIELASEGCRGSGVLSLDVERRFLRDIMNDPDDRGPEIIIRTRVTTNCLVSYR